MQISNSTNGCQWNIILEVRNLGKIGYFSQRELIASMSRSINSVAQSFLRDRNFRKSSPQTRDKHTAATILEAHIPIYSELDT